MIKGQVLFTFVFLRKKLRQISNKVCSKCQLALSVLSISTCILSTLLIIHAPIDLFDTKIFFF